MEKFLTVKEVSDVLHLGKTNTYKLFQGKDFPKITIGRKLLTQTSHTSWCAEP